MFLYRNSLIFKIFEIKQTIWLLFLNIFSSDLGSIKALKRQTQLTFVWLYIWVTISGIRLSLCIFSGALTSSFFEYICNHSENIGMAFRPYEFSHGISWPLFWWMLLGKIYTERAFPQCASSCVPSNVALVWTSTGTGYTWRAFPQCGFAYACRIYLFSWRP